MVAAGVCFGGKGRLHFVEESAKVDSVYYVGHLLPSPVDNCTRLLYIFQQDGVPAHTAHATQNWLRTNCPDFITEDHWPPNSPDFNPLDYHVWGNVGGLSQAPSQTENDRRIEGSHAGDLGQPISGTNRQLWYFCLNDVILLHDCLDIFERAKIARWQHCSADNFTTL